MNITQAILHLFPNADPAKDFIVKDEGKGQFISEWNLTDPEPTQTQIEEAWIASKTKWENETIRLKRRAEYPVIGDQLDALWKAFVPPAGSEAETMKAKIEAVKAKFPKI
jgi:hypothetical protein